MRKEAKLENQITLERVHGYHERNYSEDCNYAYAGFTENLLFTSDRAVKLTPRGNDLVKPDGSVACGFGLEIETECSRIAADGVLAEVLQKIVFTHFPANLFKLQRDGSLGGNSSAECITQIMTKAFIRNNYKNFKTMYNTYFPAFGISCGVNCGMHTNISLGLFGKTPEKQADNVRKLYYFINRNFDFCCALLNRDRRRTTYCDRQDYSDARNLELHGRGSDHYCAFNLGHYDEGRIELRLVGGQKDFGCFRNTLECIFHLINAVNRLSWAKLDDMTKVFEGCNQYVYDRLKTKVKDAGQIDTATLFAIRDTVKREELI